jgi:hypothetical protein
MKLLTPIFCMILVIACKSNQVSVAENPMLYAQSLCPEDGVCTFEVLKDKNLIVKTDEFGNHYKEVVTGEHIVLKFEYKRNEIPNTADGGYTEEIYIELNPNEIESELQNSELKKVNLLFGRLCFCRGQTGYYEIDNGVLTIIKSGKDTYQLHLEFKCEVVPQIIATLNETFKL